MLVKWLFCFQPKVTDYVEIWPSLVFCVFVCDLYILHWFKGNEYIFRGENSQKLVCLIFYQEFSLNGKNLLRSNSFPFRVSPFSEEGWKYMRATCIHSLLNVRRSSGPYYNIYLKQCWIKQLHEVVGYIIKKNTEPRMFLLFPAANETYSVWELSHIKKPGNSYVHHIVKPKKCQIIAVCTQNHPVTVWNLLHW